MADPLFDNFETKFRSHIFEKWTQLEGSATLRPDLESGEMKDLVAAAIARIYEKYNNSPAAQHADFLVHALQNGTLNPNLLKTHLNDIQAVIAGFENSLASQQNSGAPLTEPRDTEGATVDGTEVTEPSIHRPREAARAREDREQALQSEDPEVAAAAAANQPVYESIFGTLTKSEVERIRRSHMKREQQDLRDPSSLLMITAIYGGFENQPSYIEALAIKARRAGKNFDEWHKEAMETPEGQQKLVEDFYATSLLFQQNKTSSGRDAGLKQFRIEQNWYGDNPHSWIDWRSAKLVYVDALGNEYSDTGSGVTTKLRGPTKDADGNPVPAEKFSSYHAMNSTAVFIAARCRKMNPGVKQQMNITVGASGIGMPGRMQEIRDMMIISALINAEKAGVVANIHEKRFGIKTAIRTENVEKFIKGLNPTALSNMEHHLAGVDGGLKGLLERYNKRHDIEATIEGDTPAAADRVTSQAESNAEVRFVRNPTQKTQALLLLAQEHGIFDQETDNKAAMKERIATPEALALFERTLKSTIGEGYEAKKREKLRLIANGQISPETHPDILSQQEIKSAMEATSASIRGTATRRDTPAPAGSTIHL